MGILAFLGMPKNTQESSPKLLFAPTQHAIDRGSGVHFPVTKLGQQLFILEEAKSTTRTA
jgi:hypothetical protein